MCIHYKLISTYITTATTITTPGLHYKIPVFSDPAPGKYYAATYEQMGSWATQPLANILRAGILLWRPGVLV